MNRRHFVMSTALAAGAAGTRLHGAPKSANDTVRVACVGLRGRGNDNIKGFEAQPNVDLVALCDVDQSILDTRTKEVEAKTGKRPKGYTDIRKMLEDKSIDAFSIATPNHWHALMTIWGCQAGKDVYCEKPATHNIFEAQQVVAAARKYDRIVQMGSQSRSGVALQEAISKVRGGELGDVYMARALCFKWRDTIGREPATAVPAGVDYDLWTGPAPKREFTKNRFHYNWHWFWDTGNGDIGNQGIHEMDIARWGLGVKYPTKVTSIGGHFMFDDDQETPNTLNSAFEFDDNGKKKMLVFDVRHWMTNHEAGICEKRKEKDGKPDPNTVGNIFYGSKGYLGIEWYDRYQSWLGKYQEKGPEKIADGDHYANFIKAVRSHKRSDLTAEIEEGAASTVLVHLANISYRVGRTVNFDATTMTCKNDAEANKLLTRAYRAPFVVPKSV
jgi:predicted dehydrogenase